MILTIPFPPSNNSYYRRVGYRTLISREGRKYREAICASLGGSGRPPLDGRIALAMDAFPPDRRRRDLDNLLKCSQDSMAHAGVFQDDSQIDLLTIQRRDPCPPGRLEVRLETMPLGRCLLCGQPLNQQESEHHHDN